MKKKNLLPQLLITIGTALIFLVLCLTNSFEKLDYRLYDGLLHLLKDPQMSDKIQILEINDNDIRELGEWPWSRDILADSLIRMKELGAEKAIFDIEYISPSKKAIAANATENINNKIYETELTSQDLIRSIPNAAQNGYGVEDLTNLSDELIKDYLYPTYTDLYSFVENNIAFDNDEYFAKAIQFFENTWLTVNNGDLKYEVPDEYKNYIRNRIMTYNIDDPHNYIKKNNLYTFDETYNGEPIGFIPALEKLVSHAQGLGYTNSNIDNDGTRRRMELFYEYDGKYAASLTFAPLLFILDAHNFKRTKNSLYIYDAQVPGETKRRTIRIPLDEHGCMLINWQHEDSGIKQPNKYCGINSEGVNNLLWLDRLEKTIITNLTTIFNEYQICDDDGYAMEYVYVINEILQAYDEIKAFKEYLLNKCTGYDINNNPYDGIAKEEYDQYFDARKQFFNTVLDFTQAGYLDEINEFLGARISNSEEDIEFVQTINDIFNAVANDIKTYLNDFEEEKKLFNGRYVIIGMTAASTTDIGAIPFEKQYMNVGVHANVMNTVLTQNFIKVIPWYVGFIASFIFALILLLFINKSNTFQNIVGGVSKVIIITFTILIFVLFQAYIPMVGSVLIYSLIDYLAGVIYRYLISSREKKFITQIASSFANKDTVEQLTKNPELFSTKGEKKVITALFSDVQKFSTLSECLAKIHGDEAPNKLVEILNEYLGDMSNEILYNQGTIDKYEGDAIISMFGAPDSLKLHTKEEWSYLCLDSAIRMKKQEEKFNSTHSELFEPHTITNKDGEEEIVQLKPLQTRIGINTGDAYVGLMGSKTETFSKLNYTMMGDTVNLASRLEGVNKVYKTWIMCSDDTWKLANTGANEGKITTRRLDRVRVVGRSTPVQLYNIVGFTDELSDDQKKMLEVFEQGMDKYLEKDFVKAGKLFTEAAKIGGGDDTSLVFAERCKNYVEKGVPENWDGVMNMTSK